MREIIDICDVCGKTIDYTKISGVLNRKPAVRLFASVSSTDLCYDCIMEIENLLDKKRKRLGLPVEKKPWLEEWRRKK